MSEQVPKQYVSSAVLEPSTNCRSVPGSIFRQFYQECFRRFLFLWDDEVMGVIWIAD